MRLSARVVPFMLVGSLWAFAAPVQAQVCGDNTVDPGETCDPPNLAPDPVRGQPSCRLDCTFCGDGVVQPQDDETCDNVIPSMCGGCLKSCIEPIIYNTKCPCESDDPTLVGIRTDILAACQCGTAASKREFLRCAREQLALTSTDIIFPHCRRSLLKCLTRSVCGQPEAVTCCRTNAQGAQRCAIKPDVAHCTAPPGGAAALGVSETCCDACP